MKLLEATEPTSFVARMARLIARCESVKLTALGAAEARRAGDLTGARSTAHWVADATGDRRGAARHDVKLAAKLGGLDGARP